MLCTGSDIYAEKKIFTVFKWKLTSRRMYFGKGNGKPLQYSCLENPMKSMKRQKDMTLKDELPRSVGAQQTMREEWRNSCRKNEEAEPKWKQHPVVDTFGDGSHIGGWKAKVGSQEILGVTGKFGLGVQNEAGQRLTVLPREHIVNTLFQNIRDDSTHGHNQMVNTESRLMIFFAAKDGEALYSQ